MEALLRYDWPGNVRELKGAIDSGVTLAIGNQITVRDLPLTVRGASGGLAPREVGNQGLVNIHDNETRLIMRALDESGGNRTEAAKKLGISRRTLHRRLKELQLPE
jgi:DNA-binding NtrC family response regulator